MYYLVFFFFLFFLLSFLIMLQQGGKLMIYPVATIKLMICDHTCKTKDLPIYPKIIVSVTIKQNK